ncbi:hypothetical protein [Autumnicola psychrophila]|uniref:Uncharacterized protein n=1 Tax=Autumnicola psychrophila TaxID=3075592 RepID=A0ABU3DWG3_9FLAO|nr:hypothetical protein [Zunongwangia sp. F225]MDT0688057.1 hypothetical protein [Zunongwangia sp. F225]
METEAGILGFRLIYAEKFYIQNYLQGYNGSVLHWYNHDSQ